MCVGNRKARYQKVFYYSFSVHSFCFLTHRKCRWSIKWLHRKRKKEREDEHSASEESSAPVFWAPRKKKKAHWKEIRELWPLCELLLLHIDRSAPQAKRTNISRWLLDYGCFSILGKQRNSSAGQKTIFSLAAHSYRQSVFVWCAYVPNVFYVAYKWCAAHGIICRPHRQNTNMCHLVCNSNDKYTGFKDIKTFLSFFLHFCLSKNLVHNFEYIEMRILKL